MSCGRSQQHLYDIWIERGHHCKKQSSFLQGVGLGLLVERSLAKMCMLPAGLRLLFLFVLATNGIFWLVL